MKTFALIALRVAGQIWYEYETGLTKVGATVNNELVEFKQFKTNPAAVRAYRRMVKKYRLLAKEAGVRVTK